jgi:flotillin
VFIYLKVNLQICEPNEILILSGRKRRTKAGDTVGYRVIRGGWGLRLPIVERVSRLGLSTISIPLEIDRAMSNGMIPLSITAIAHVKIASREGGGLENAVERLLRKPPNEIETIAKTTIDGVLRGVLATFTPEDAMYRRRDLEEAVLEKARGELMNLGFTLDTFKIENITDSQGYYDAVGRQRGATVKRDARIKEAESEAEANVVESESRMKSAHSEFRSKSSIEEAETTFRNHKAELNEETNRREIRASFARSLEEIRQKDLYHQLNAEKNRKKFDAEIVIPARAEREASGLKAAGQAAYQKEFGLAMASAVREMKTEWNNGETRDLFMMHLMPGIVDSVSRVLKDNLKVDKVVVMGNGGIPGHVGDVASSVVTLLEKIKGATGMDLTNLGAEKKTPLARELK